MDCSESEGCNLVVATQDRCNLHSNKLSRQPAPHSRHIQRQKSETQALHKSALHGAPSVHKGHCLQWDWRIFTNRAPETARRTGGWSSQRCPSSSRDSAPQKVDKINGKFARNQHFHRRLYKKTLEAATMRFTRALCPSAEKIVPLVIHYCLKFSRYFLKSNVNWTPNKIMYNFQRMIS